LKNEIIEELVAVMFYDKTNNVIFV